MLADRWLATCVALKRADAVSDVAELRALAGDLRTEFERLAREAGHSDLDVQEALFALAAFFDETVMQTKGTARETWKFRKLGFEWFGTNAAGDEFFTPRLESLRALIAEATRLLARVISILT